MSSCTSLSQIGYYFDKDNVLKTIKGNSKFTFTTQEDYEKLGEAITTEIYNLLESKYDMIRLPVKPVDSNLSNGEVGFIYASKDFNNKSTLLVLIHGSGVVRAGQWARKLIINDNLNSGTMFPYIERAQANDWGVVCLNTNHNTSFDNNPLKFSEDPVTHAQTSWDVFIKSSMSRKIFVVAHSRGGNEIASILEKNYDDERISIVCLTDSHFFKYPEKMSLRKKHPLIVHFVADQKLKGKSNDRDFKNEDVVELYAGTTVHEVSNISSMEAIFKILENKLDDSNLNAVIQDAANSVNEF